MRALRLLLALTLIAAAFAVLPDPVTAPPGTTKTKVFYLHNATQDLGAGPVRVANTTLGTAAGEGVDVGSSPTQDLSWFLYPRMAGDLTLDAGAVTVHVWFLVVNAGGAGTTSVGLHFNLYEVSAAGTRLGGAFLSGAITAQITTHYSEYGIPSTLTAPRTIPAGNTLEVELGYTGAGSPDKQVAWGSERYRSRLELPLQTYLNIDSAGAQNTAGSVPAFFNENEDIHLVANLSNPLGGYDVRWVNVTVLAPDGSVVFNRVDMVQTAGGPATLFTAWERVYSGLGKLRGVYNVTVEAADNTGYFYRFPDRPGDETFGGHRENVSFTFVIGEQVYANFRVLDDVNQVVPGAVVELWEGAFLRASATTDASGIANLTGVPGIGAYVARVVWAGVRVYDNATNIPGNVTASAPIDLAVQIYLLGVAVVDVGNVGLGGAAVFVTYPNGTSTLTPFITDPAGRASLGRVPVGTHDFRVVWLGAEVHLSSVAVTASGTLRLRADVYYVTFVATDKALLPVENVQFLVTDTVRDLAVSAVTTDPSGIAQARLAVGDYEWEAWWSGARVANATPVSLNATLGNQTVPVPLRIYYVDVHVFDGENRSVLGAFVALESPEYTASGITDDRGFVEDLRVPAADFTLTASWDGVEVHSSLVTVAGNQTFVVSARVFDLTVRAQDSGLKTLSGVFVTVQRGNVTVAAAVTNARGEATFRLPAANYTVSLRLVTTYLLTGIDDSETVLVTLDGAKTVTATFTGFPIPLYATVVFGLINAILLILIVFYLLYRRRKQKTEEATASTKEEEPGPATADPREPAETAKPSESPPMEPVVESVTPAPTSAEAVPDAGEALAGAPATVGVPMDPPTPLAPGVSDGSLRCGVCHGRIKEGLPLLRCLHCFAAYHERCASGLERCATCGRPIAPMAA